MFSIGEFSKATRLTVKTLRYYHEIGLIVPDRIDPATGYRYYDEPAFDRVRMIYAMKEMGFTLSEILSILSCCRNEREMISFVENKLSDVNDRLKKLGGLIKGKPRCLHFNLEFREDDADFMPCFEVSQAVRAEGITCMCLERGRTLSMRHRGPYQTLGITYVSLFLSD